MSEMMDGKAETGEVHRVVIEFHLRRKTQEDGTQNHTYKAEIMESVITVLHHGMHIANIRVGQDDPPMARIVYCGYPFCL